MYNQVIESLIKEANLKKSSKLDTKTLIKRFLNQRGIKTAGLPQWPNKNTPKGDSLTDRLKPTWEQTLIKFYNKKNGTFKQVRKPFSPVVYSNLQMNSINVTSQTMQNNNRT